MNKCRFRFFFFVAVVIVDGIFRIYELYIDERIDESHVCAIVQLVCILLIAMYLTKSQRINVHCAFPS